MCVFPGEGREGSLSIWVHRGLNGEALRRDPGGAENTPGGAKIFPLAKFRPNKSFSFTRITKLLSYSMFKVILTVKPSGCLVHSLQICFGPLIIDYIFHSLIWPPQLQLIKLKSFESLTSVSILLTRCQNKGKYIKLAIGSARIWSSHLWEK